MGNKDTVVIWAYHSISSMRPSCGNAVATQTISISHKCHPNENKIEIEKKNRMKIEEHSKSRWHCRGWCGDTGWQHSSSAVCIWAEQLHLNLYNGNYLVLCTGNGGRGPIWYTAADTGACHQIHREMTHFASFCIEYTAHSNTAPKTL